MCTFILTTFLYFLSSRISFSILHECATGWSTTRLKAEIELEALRNAFVSFFFKKKKKNHQMTLQSAIQ